MNFNVHSNSNNENLLTMMVTHKSSSVTMLKMAGVICSIRNPPKRTITNAVKVTSTNEYYNSRGILTIVLHSDNKLYDDYKTSLDNINSRIRRIISNHIPKFNVDNVSVYAIDKDGSIIITSYIPCHTMYWTPRATSKYHNKTDNTSNKKRDFSVESRPSSAQSQSQSIPKEVHDAATSIIEYRYRMRHYKIIQENNEMKDASVSRLYNEICSTKCVVTLDFEFVNVKENGIDISIRCNGIYFKPNVCVLDDDDIKAME